jgi:hypothetical protein
MACHDRSDNAETLQLISSLNFGQEKTPTEMSVGADLKYGCDKPYFVTLPALRQLVQTRILFGLP